MNAGIEEAINNGLPKISQFLDRCIKGWDYLLVEELSDEVESRVERLSIRPALDLGLAAGDMLARVPLFEQLDSEEHGEVARLLKPRFVTPGARIISRGETGDEMYFIATGAVKVQTPDQAIYLGSGDFFGELALISDAPRNADVSSEEYCRLLVLSSRDFRALMARNAPIREAVHRVAEERSRH